VFSELNDMRGPRWNFVVVVVLSSIKGTSDTFMYVL